MSGPTVVQINANWPDLTLDQYDRLIEYGKTCVLAGAAAEGAPLRETIDRLERELAEAKARAIPDGWAAVPEELTAENGAKAALIGEFEIRHPVACMACESGGYAGWDECPECHGEGTVEDSILISWTMLKTIHARVVGLYARPQSPGESNVE